jgi:hypothetical protein
MHIVPISMASVTRYARIAHLISSRDFISDPNVASHRTVEDALGTAFTVTVDSACWSPPLLGISAPVSRTHTDSPRV